MNDKDPSKPPDRPLECSECKKPIAIKYTEIIGDSITHTSMCSDCPEYLRRLHGQGYVQSINVTEGTGLACGNCGTTLDAVRMGTPLGCSNCYEVFGETIFTELHAIQKLPGRLTVFRKSTPIHIGRGPGEVKEMNLSMKLLALNEALNETLKAENYEQAALLRDQIKELTEQNPELKEQNDGQK